MYGRSKYTLFEMIGDLGGFNGAIILFPAYFMSLYSSLMFQKDTTEEAPVYNHAPKDHKKPKSKHELSKKVLEGQETLSQEDVRNIFEQVKRISRHSIPFWSSLCNFCGAHKRSKRSRLL